MPSTAHHDLKIVYTPLHGTGVILVPESLRKYGFTNVLTVKEQNIPDGNFPDRSVPEPGGTRGHENGDRAGRPSEQAGDRAGDRPRRRPHRDGAAGPRTDQYVLLNGNQTCAAAGLLHRQAGGASWDGSDGKEYIVKTIVTTGAGRPHRRIVRREALRLPDGLQVHRHGHAQPRSGRCSTSAAEKRASAFCAEDFVRDKDAVSACSLAAEAAAWAKSART